PSRKRRTERGTVGQPHLPLKRSAAEPSVGNLPVFHRAFGRARSAIGNRLDSVLLLQLLLQLVVRLLLFGALLLRRQQFGRRKRAYPADNRKAQGNDDQRDRHPR